MSQNYIEGKSNQHSKHIIILGSGFAGIEVLKSFKKIPETIKTILY